MSESRYCGALLGLACGDAVGTTVEFRRRDTFPLVTDMVGGGPFNLRPGEWTDDTSMALCLAVSLLEQKKFDAADQMNRYLRWKEHGYLSSNGRCFDIGITVLTALGNYRATGNPISGSKDPQSAGNGCLMRLAPVPMYFRGDYEQALLYSELSAQTTHAASECLEATRLFAAMLFAALEGKSKEQILYAGSELNFNECKVAAIAAGEYLGKERDKIESTGYVIHSLEAALWCFARTTSFEEAILVATNLGGDADTVAAICGQVAGAYYGYDNIPASWLEKLAHGEFIESVARQLWNFQANF